MGRPPHAPLAGCSTSSGGRGRPSLASAPPSLPFPPPSVHPPQHPASPTGWCLPAHRAPPRPPQRRRPRKSAIPKPAATTQSTAVTGHTNARSKDARADRSRHGDGESAAPRPRPRRAPRLTARSSTPEPAVEPTVLAASEPGLKKVGSSSSGTSGGSCRVVATAACKGVLHGLAAVASSSPHGCGAEGVVEDDDKPRRRRSVLCVGRARISAGFFSLLLPSGRHCEDGGFSFPARGVSWRVPWRLSALWYSRHVYISCGESTGRR